MVTDINRLETSDDSIVLSFSTAILQIISNHRTDLSHFPFINNILFINPALLAGIPGANTLGEPVSNLLLGTLDGIASMAYVPSDFNAVYGITNSFGGRLSG